MTSSRRSLAAAELLLILPAALFMTALFVRNLQPVPYEPAATAQRIVDWYAARPQIALWGFLMALPLLVFSIGATTLLRAWKADAQLRQAAGQLLTTLRTHLATFLIAAATLTAVGILGIVALHVISG